LIDALAQGDGKTVVDTSEALRLNGISAAATMEEMSMVLQRMAVLQAVRDLKTGQFELGKIQKVGLQNAQAVRLTMAADVPDAVRQKIAQVSADIQAGKVKIPEAYSGPEFATPA